MTLEAQFEVRGMYSSHAGKFSGRESTPWHVTPDVGGPSPQQYVLRTSKTLGKFEVSEDIGFNEGGMKVWLEVALTRVGLAQQARGRISLDLVRGFKPRGRSRFEG
ncbi:hypothetical protein CROQUDRAFT_96867 [Cronartium quercuum f. sp. fusiforme G11]|uniref:Uncharacterized protein n=1 Tax=Cronartium quercuum f. sp. fusiforme G11 TaxID=708437 RepID=A0A9P6T8C5_9BASI|nr:hypothetical protein CROQUDRAFT_96867 [Cronartium quercuum f. sp. fusiforme G11]